MDETVVSLVEDQKDRQAFFRRGRSGAGEEVLGPDGVARYHERMAELTPPDVAAWLDHGRGDA